MKKFVTIEDLKAIPTPPATPTWTPIGHHQLASSIKTISQDVLNMELIGESYELARDDQQIFSVLTFKSDHSEIGLSVGFRSSLDKSLSVGLCMGASVRVCSNLMFSASNGGIVLLRKHSRNILDTLEDLAITNLYKARYTFASLVKDAERMSSKKIGLDEAYRLMGYLYGHGLLTPRQLPIVHANIVSPPHAAFQPSNLYSFYNACTEALKTSPPSNALERYIGVHTAMIEHCEQYDVMETFRGAIS